MWWPAATAGWWQLGAETMDESGFSRVNQACLNGWIVRNPWWFEKTHRQGTQQWRHHKAWRSTRRSGDGFLTAGCPRQVSKRRDSPSIDVDKKTLAASASFHEWIKYHVSETKVKIVKTSISELDQDCWRCIDSFFEIGVQWLQVMKRHE